MKKIVTRIFSTLLMVLGVAVFFVSCDEDSTDDVTLFTPGTVDATASTSSIEAGESVTFTDMSTKVYERNWTFIGGTPSGSTDSVVTVTYERGGTYTAVLDIRLIDNQTGSIEFTTEVEGNEAPPVEGLGFYSENIGLENSMTPSYWEPNNGYNIETTETAFEGMEATLLAFKQEDTWGTMASLKPSGGSVDISEYADGYYNVSIKTTCTKTMLLRLQSSNGAKGIITLDPSEEPYGLIRDGNWYSLKIPMADFLATSADLDLTKISDLLVFRSGESDAKASEDWDFYVDHIYLSK